MSVINSKNNISQKNRYLMANFAKDSQAFLKKLNNNDMVNNPPHYTSDPSGVECITITRHRNFNIGNAIKYLWRNGLKDSTQGEALSKQIEDLEKAVFYINDEIKRLRGDY
jgi:hypothetical protein